MSEENNIPDTDNIKDLIQYLIDQQRLTLEEVRSTKAEVFEVKKDLSEFKQEMREFRSETKESLHKIETRIRHETQMRVDIEDDMAKLRRRVEELEAKRN
jgi:hypothetical protein